MIATLPVGTSTLTVKTAHPSRVFAQLDALGEAITYSLTSAARGFVKYELVIEITPTPGYDVEISF